MSDPAPGPGSTAPVNVTALVREAASKSGLIWVGVPGDRAWPVWHVWLDDSAYVVSGPGEQPLPWLPEQVSLTFRSKDTGGRLVTVTAATATLTPDDPRWPAATAALRASRLNAPGGVDLIRRWADTATVTCLTPYGAPLESPGSYDQRSGAAPPAPTPATTRTWNPWHWKGRPKRRRGTR